MAAELFDDERTAESAAHTDSGVVFAAPIYVTNDVILFLSAEVSFGVQSSSRVISDFPFGLVLSPLLNRAISLALSIAYSSRPLFHFRSVADEVVADESAVVLPLLAVSIALKIF